MNLRTNNFFYPALVAIHKRIFDQKPVPAVKPKEVSNDKVNPVFPRYDMDRCILLEIGCAVDLIKPPVRPTGRPFDREIS